ncbi:hypothetical protein C7271_02555, partial [filamentous cyanobacterium CCP5]
MAASYPLPTNENQRLAALHEYGVLDTDAEPAFDGLTDLAAYICQTPIALISLIDSQRQWFKAKVGLDLSETPRDQSFCTYTVCQPGTLIVPDARQDQRFANNPLVISEPHICFYAGTPLITPEGYAIGTLCVIDAVPRVLSQKQQESLETLAQQVVDQLELRQAVSALQEAVREKKRTGQALENAVEGISQLDGEGRYVTVNPAYGEMVGYSLGEMVGLDWRQTVHPEDIADVETAYQQMLQVGKAEAEVRGVRKDGSLFYKQVVLVQVRDTLPGQALHYCFMKDITSRKQAEADLKRAYDDLERQVAERTAALTQANQLLQQEVIRRQQNERTLQRQAQRERLMGEIAQRIRQSLNLDDILQTTVQEVRQFLAVDRVFIYRFDANWSGVVAFEVVKAPWISTLGRRLIDPCFAEQYTERYQQGRIHGMDNIETAGLSDCYVEFLESLQVKANLVVPILQGETLWGLLIAHQCSRPRCWRSLEIDLMQQLSTQVAIAIQQANLYQQLTAANQELQRLAVLDGLTQVGNRRCFDDYLEAEWQRARREQLPLALVLCDIDFFKAYNDAYGHQQGDTCLRQIAQAIQDAIERPADVVARYGGEEFAVVLPNTRRT